MNQVSIASTLSGKIAVKHPVHCVLCREDGAILNWGHGGRYVHRKAYEIPHAWTFGYKDADGYFRIRFKGKTYKAHRIICEAFRDNPDNKPTVDHVDRNPSNNCVDNLRWATMAEQVDNCSRIISRLPYSVRERDNRQLYDKEYRANHRAEKREHDRQYWERNKERIKLKRKISREARRTQINV